MSSRSHAQEILLCRYLGVDLGYKVYIFSGVLSDAKMFSKVVVPVYVPTAVDQSAHCITSPPALNII